MAKPLLKPHPRLYLSPKAWKNLARPAAHPLEKAAEKALLRSARKAAVSPTFKWERNTHNAHLVRARIMQGRVIDLLAAWKLTGKDRFRDAARAHLFEMDRWPEWSWIAWRKGKTSPNAIFDLSYGENSATLAIGYDVLFDTLDASDKRKLQRIARRRAFKPLLKNTPPQGNSFWFKRPDSNWNTVCAGGAGMLALAMHEDVPECATVLKRAEQSIAPYFQHLKDTGGAWPEGIGYWNYGMRYGFMYLLSHEQATGRRHPLLKIPEVKASLSFPGDFCPNRVPCSFGDVNRWAPNPFHFAIAERLRSWDVLTDLRARMRPEGFATARPGWPQAAEFRLLCPPEDRKAGKARARKAGVHAKLYKGLNWGVLADRPHRPNLYVAVRGGTTEVPHGHRDLLSFHGVVGDEALIENLGVFEYLDTTFSPRRNEIFEVTPASKNTILINGVGIVKPSQVSTRVVRRGKNAGLLLHAAEAMGGMRDGRAAEVCSRLFLMLEGKALLILDRIVLPQPGRVETRMHTHASVKATKAGARLKGARQRMAVAYAANVPARLFTAETAPTTPGQSATVLRWCSQNRLATDYLLGTLLVPGAAATSLSLAPHGRGFAVKVRAGSLRKTVRVSSGLTLR